MHLLIAALLGVAQYVSVANAACCFPVQFEGERLFVEDQEIRTFAVDYSVDRIYDAANPYSDVFDILDLANDRVYHWNGANCSYKHSMIPRHFPQCLRAGLRKIALGDENRDLKAYGFEIMEDDSHSYFVVGGKFPDCSPLFAQTKINNFVHTAVFTNVRLGVSHEKLYTKFDDCVEHEEDAKW